MKQQEEGGGGDDMTVLIINFVSRVNDYHAGRKQAWRASVTCQMHEDLTEDEDGSRIFDISFFLF